MDRHKQTVHVEDGQRVDEHVAGLPAPVVFEHPRIAEQIAMAEHRAFAAAGGTAGVQNGGQIRRCPRSRLVHITVLGRALQQAASAVFVKSENVLHATGERLFTDSSKTG